MSENSEWVAIYLERLGHHIEEMQEENKRLAANLVLVRTELDRIQPIVDAAFEWITADAALSKEARPGRMVVKGDPLSQAAARVHAAEARLRATLTLEEQ